jgi:ABC-type phosphate transport system auxiliary subunit
LYGFLEERWDIDEAAVKAVHEELYGEFSYPNRGKPAVQSAVDIPGAETLTAESGDVERRLVALEKNLEALENRFHREFGLLRRAILFNPRPSP